MRSFLARKSCIAFYLVGLVASSDEDIPQVATRNRSFPCEDVSRKVTVPGLKRRRGCTQLSEEGYCSIVPIRLQCQKSCGLCEEKERSLSSIFDLPSERTCTDATGKVAALIGGKLWNKPCATHLKKGHCELSEVVKSSCPDSCDNCGPSEPTKAPTAAPTPSDGPSCVDTSGTFTITIGTKKWKNKTCLFHEGKGHCGESIVQDFCPKSCDGCGGGGPSPPTPAPGPSCDDSTEKFKVNIGGKVWNKFCAWYVKNGHCNISEVKEQCPDSCDNCGPSEPTKAPTAAPTPSDGPPCVDTSGTFTVTIGTKKWKNKTCLFHSDRGHCGESVVQDFCPKSCDGCGGGGPSPPTPAPGPSCDDSTEKFKVNIGGKVWNKFCAWYVKNGHCNISEVKKQCPDSCDSCGPSPTSAPSAAPTTELMSITRAEMEMSYGYDRILSESETEDLESSIENFASSMVGGSRRLYDMARLLSGTITFEVTSQVVEGGVLKMDCMMTVASKKDMQSFPETFTTYVNDNVDEFNDMLNDAGMGDMGFVGTVLGEVTDGTTSSPTAGPTPTPTKAPSPGPTPTPTNADPTPTPTKAPSPGPTPSPPSGEDPTTSPTTKPTEGDGTFTPTAFDSSYSFSYSYSF